GLPLRLSVLPALASEGATSNGRAPSFTQAPSDQVAARQPRGTIPPPTPLEAFMPPKSLPWLQMPNPRLATQSDGLGDARGPRELSARCPLTSTGRRFLIARVGEYCAGSDSTYPRDDPGVHKSAFPFDLAQSAYLVEFLSCSSVATARPNSRFYTNDVLRKWVARVWETLRGRKLTSTPASHVPFLVKALSQGQGPLHPNPAFVRVASIPDLLQHNALPAIQDVVVSTAMRAALMANADNRSELTGTTRDCVFNDGLNIFLAALCHYEGLECGVAWFDSVLGPAISAADSAYMNTRAMPAGAVPGAPPPAVTTYDQAVALLVSPTCIPASAPKDSDAVAPTSSALADASGSIPREDSSTSALSDPTAASPSAQGFADAVAVGGGEAPGGMDGQGFVVEKAVVPRHEDAVPVEGNGDEASGGKKAQGVGEEAVVPPGMSKMRLVGSVLSDVAEHEGKELLAIAQKDGVFAMAAAAPRVLAVGFISMLAAGGPRGTKRKAEADGEQEVANGGSPRQRRRSNPAPDTLPTAPPPTSTPSAPPAGVLPTTAPPTTPPPSSNAGPSAPAAGRASRRHNPRSPEKEQYSLSPRRGPSVAQAVRRIESSSTPASRSCDDPHSSSTPARRTRRPRSLTISNWNVFVSFVDILRL
ncbi:hypothetical protein C8R46DRAFT_1302107, partial [Mycena filopes]